MNLRPSFTYTTAFVLLTFSGALASPATTAQYLAQNFIIPRYDAVAAAAAMQESAWNTYCVDRAHGSTMSLRKAYHNVGDVWAGVEFIRLGPANTGLRAERFNYWFDRGDVTGRSLSAMLVSRDPKSLDAAAIASGSAAGQGMPLLERLLYDDRALARLQAKGPDGDRRCAIGEAVAHNLSSIATAIASDWNGSRGAAAAIAANRAWGPHFANASQAAGVMLTDLVAALEALKDFKVPMMVHDIAHPRAIRLAEGARSGRALKDIRINLAGIRKCIDAFMASATAAQKSRLDAAFANADGKLADVAATEATKNKAKRLAALRQAVDSFSALKLTAMNVIPQATGISLGFNSLDGD